MKYNLAGKWQILLNDETKKEDGFLPGTLDENCLGNEDKVAKAWHPDVEERNKKLEKDENGDSRIATRLTRNFTYEGPAVFKRTFDFDMEPSGKRYFLSVERARAMTLRVDGLCAPMVKGGLSVPYEFEVTDFLHRGSLLEITTDNTYPGMPYRDITFSSAATDETQTNWNGVVGELFVAEKEQVFLSDVRVYPRYVAKDDGYVLDIAAEISALDPFENTEVTVTIDGECLEKIISVKKPIADGLNEIDFSDLEITKTARQELWDELEGKLHKITATLEINGKKYDEKEITFGIREFSYDESGRLTLNGRRIFLRSEANCALFPETGHPPMDKNSWDEIMKTYASYGVNCVRFHSWTPPKAAFEAADELGMLIQTELPNWNPRDAFSDKCSRDFYENEIVQILKCYANHPSFVMLTMGNELHTDEAGIEEMHKLIRIAKDMDSTRLYAWGSNNFYGAKGPDPESDFFTSSNDGDEILRLSGNAGKINVEKPDTKKNFSDLMKQLRENYKKPFFSFEVGQYEILPDMHELRQFKGVTRPDNLLIVRDRQKASGMSDDEWEKRVAATGEIALLGYREEVEAVLRTPEMSGISLLGLQDFTGQGTALVGMLNSHLRAKEYPFALPERFVSFFRPVSVLALMDSYTYETGDVFRAEIKLANYGKDIISSKFEFKLSYKDSGNVYIQGESDKKTECPVGNLSSMGTVEIPLDGIYKDCAFVLTIWVGDISSTYPIWVYPPCNPVCPSGVYETKVMDDKAKKILEEGGKVYYSPDSTIEAIPNSIKAQFTTDFWSVGTFPAQEGAMGLLIDQNHPLFRDFPTEERTNWQWFHMASQRAFILPRYMNTIVAQMDCYVSLRPMAMLYEAKCGKGKLLASSMGLQNLQQYPEARALLDSIYRYMASEEFSPVEEVEW